MADDVSRLYGSCACERNQYTIELPAASASSAPVHVFFDNSASSRRPQASPVTAWLRIPLDYYHSVTVAQFPDESHATIRRTFLSRSAHAAPPSVRRQFCGYCGTHLTAFDEAARGPALIDVTLGSLLDESLEVLEGLDLLPEEDDGKGADERGDAADGLVRGGSVNEEMHVTTTEAEGKEDAPSGLARHMQHRGMPYFESLIENSSLGRIRRQRGGHTLDDGRTVVQWEVIEYDGDQDVAVADAPVLGGGNVAKRIKIGV